MSDACANQNSHTNTNSRSNRGLAGRILRICVPALLWTIVGIAAPVFVTVMHRSDRATQEDFAVYYFEAQEMRHNINPYTTDFGLMPRSRGLNIHGIRRGNDPPTFIAFLFVPLTHVPLRTAYWIWQTLNAACLFGALYLLLGHDTGLVLIPAITLGAIALLYPAIASHFWFAQSKFPLLLLLVLMMRWANRKHEAWAGFALALSILLRIFPLVLTGYLILQHRWRILTYTVAGLLAGIALTIAAGGFENCLAFALSLSAFANDSWNGIQRDLAANFFISREIWSISPHPGAGLELIRHALIVAVDSLVIAATTRVTLKVPAGEDPDSRIFSLWVATAVFLLPIAWDYDLALMLIPFSQLAVVAARGEASRRAIAMAVLSYLLLIWWEYVALSSNESGFFSMLTAYLSAYWLATDQPAAVNVPLLSVPGEIWRRLAPTG